MILSFRHKGLEDFYRSGGTRGIQFSHAAKLIIILTALDAASAPDELSLPAFKLHPLKGKHKDHWSIWVNASWRITFGFNGPNVELVDYLDYH